jgi:hypothetical protein
LLFSQTHDREAAALCRTGTLTPIPQVTPPSAAAVLGVLAKVIFVDVPAEVVRQRWQENEQS